jgi:hypothetical protein
MQMKVRIPPAYATGASGIEEAGGLGPSWNLERPLPSKRRMVFVPR